MGLRVAIARTSVIFGPERGAASAMATPFRLGLGGPMGSGRQWFPWISLADVVGIYLMLIDSDHAGVFLATAPEPIRQADFAKTFGKVVGRPAVFPAPAFGLKILLGEFANEVLDSRRCIPERTLAEGYQFVYPDLAAALRVALEEKQPA
jgi:uncharacterized protein (TIGR01777 family)